MLTNRDRQFVQEQIEKAIRDKPVEPGKFRDSPFMVTAVGGLIIALITGVSQFYSATNEQSRKFREARYDSRLKLMDTLCVDTKTYLYTTGRMLDCLKYATSPREKWAVANYKENYFALMKAQAAQRSPLSDIAQVKAYFHKPDVIKAASDLDYAFYMYEHQKFPKGGLPPATICDDLMKDLAMKMGREMREDQ